MATHLPPSPSTPEDFLSAPLGCAIPLLDLETGVAPQLTCGRGGVGFHCLSYLKACEVCLASFPYIMTPRREQPLFPAHLECGHTPTDEFPWVQARALASLRVVSSTFLPGIA